MKILVLGADTFIGKAFVKKLGRLFDITALSADEIDLLDALAVDTLVKNGRFDGVLDLVMAPEIGDGRFLEADSLIMFRNVQHAAVKYGVKKLLIVSDAADFDRTQELIDITEEMSEFYEPTDGYGRARHIITRLAGMDRITSVLRVFDLFGEGCKTDINKIASAGARGKKITIDRDATVSAVDINDLLKVIALFLYANVKKGDYNVVADDKASLLALANTVKRAARKDGKKVAVELKHVAPAAERSASNSKLLSVVPMRFKGIEKGVKALYAAGTAGRK